MPVNAVVGNMRDASTTAFGANRPYRGLEWRATHDPKYYIYLFNVSPRSFDPSTNTGFLAGRFGQRGIQAGGICDDDPVLKLPQLPGNDKVRKYHFVTSFPQPILVSRPNEDANEIGWVETDARRFVIDLLNPDNLTLSLDTRIEPDQVFSQGNDWSRRGFFFDYGNPPSEEMMTSAILKMEAYYKNLLDVAANLEMTDKPKLSQELGSNPDYAIAATYFGKDVPWNRMQIRPVSCPNCGENKPAGRKFHMASFGSLCVEPTQDAWKAVLDAGIKTFEQVPPKFQKLLAKEYGPAEARIAPSE